MTIVGLIPARSKSKRIPGKNVKRLAGHPLLAYTVRASIDSGIFSGVWVSTDTESIANVARYYGAAVIMRPPEFAQDDSYDFQWVNHAMQQLHGLQEFPDCFAILRPTNPFRQPETIRRAWAAFQANRSYDCDSLRAVKKTTPVHKLWDYVDFDGLIYPIVDYVLWDKDQPLYDMPSQLLMNTYKQTGALQIADADLIQTGHVSGVRIAPFFMDGYEDLDLNTPDDWEYAEWLIEKGKARLPKI